MADDGDGGLVDNSGVVDLLLRRVTTIIALVSSGTALANVTNSSAAVAAAVAASAAVRVLNASAVLVSVPPLPLFDVSRPEVITVAVAPSLLRFSSPPANRPRFEITAIPGTAVAIVDSERLAPRRPSDELVEAAVQSRLNLLVFRLVGDTWSEGLGSDCVGGSVGGGGSGGGGTRSGGIPDAFK